MSIASEITRLQNAKADIKISIESKGVTVPANETLSNYSDYIDSIPTGGGSVSVNEKDVNFYDYDGTAVNSYTKSEFLALNSLPENPTHEGLTSQGWNWSLSDAQDYVNEYGKLNIGQMYVTDDGSTRIYITLYEGRLSPYLGFAINGTATVDWGDGNTETVTGTSTSTLISTKHDYSSAGDYVIKISSSANIYFIGSNSYNSQVLWNKILSSSSPNTTYRNSIKKIEIGTNVTTFNTYAFSNCQLLSTITIPTNVTSMSTGLLKLCYNLNYITIPSSITIITSNAFQNCYSLSSISIPKSVTSILPSVFSSCSALQYILLPDTITSLRDSVLAYCNSLSSIIIPKTVNKIESNAFTSNHSIAYYDFSLHTSIPTLSSTNAFNSIYTDCKIIVPDSLYDTWIAATNWSNYASYIIKESDWNA